jgi:uncharacterized membrane protein YccC
VARLGPRLRRLEKPARVGVQTAAAATVTFALFKLTGLPQPSWAVISALFVIQPNVGATVGAALGRIAGTAAGTAIGLVCVLTVGPSAWAIALGLVVATGSLGFITGIRPELRYGLVPAAFIMLAPGGDALDQAWHGAAAIVIGAIMGALTGLVVFPETAHRGVERQLGEVVARCGDLLRAAVAALLGDPERYRMRSISESVEACLWAAGPVAAQSHYPSRLRKRPRHPAPRALLQAVERLWHSLLLLMPADGTVLAGQARHELAPVLQEVASAGDDYLKSLARALESNAPAPPTGPFGERVQELNAALARLRQRGATRPLEGREAARIFTLAFAVQELHRHVQGVAALFSGPDDATLRGP